MPTPRLLPSFARTEINSEFAISHGREHAERRADAELGDEVEAEEGQAADRDRDSQAGEEHGAARGGAGLGGGVDRGQPLMQELSEARDDEQRVVDADTEADHRHEQRRDRVDVGQAGEDEEQDECGRKRRQREQNRNRHRHEGAEDDDQHDQRHQQAERSCDSLLDRRELGVAVVLDRDAGRSDRFANCILNSDDGLAILEKMTRSNWASA